MPLHHAQLSPHAPEMRDFASPLLLFSRQQRFRPTVVTRYNTSAERSVRGSRPGSCAGAAARRVSLSLRLSPVLSPRRSSDDRRRTSPVCKVYELPTGKMILIPDKA